MSSRRSWIVRIFLTLVAAALIVPGVAAQKVKIETHQDEQANFGALKTYSWLPPPGA